MHFQYSYLMLVTFFIKYSSGSGLHGQCDFDEDCGTIDTHCHSGICSCKPNFIVLFDSCIQVTTPPIHCRRKEECHRALGSRSLCSKNNICACRAFHHLHNGQCVKNRDLHETCEHDHQCYCGVDCGDKIACIARNCTCKTGHRPYRSRRCILTEPLLVHLNSPSTTPKIKDIPLLTVTLFLIRLYY
ncbi:unnamed protein product, partial [Brassicogethes aeneus]